MPSPQYGPWPPNEASAAQPLGIVQLQLGAGTEAIVSQIGTLATGLVVNATGDYELALDAAQMPGFDSDRLYWTLGAGDTAARMVVLFPSLTTMQIRVFDDAGAPAAMGRLCIAFWYTSA